MQKQALSTTKTIEFVKLKDGDTLVFDITATEERAARFVQAMRVNLTRMRNAVRKKNRSVKPFTLSLVSIEYNHKTGISQITLLKKKSEHAELNAALSDILQNLDDGASIQ